MPLRTSSDRSSAAPTGRASRTNFSASGNPPGPSAFQTSPKPPAQRGHEPIAGHRLGAGDEWTQHPATSPDPPGPPMGRMVGQPAGAQSLQGLFGGENGGQLATEVAIETEVGMPQ